ncbi:MAG: Rrf2 family transcriptional regulator [Bacteroidetes bacterium]|nr:Rrf2 family transcriptional regulator [Bacteroidota bacterium]
MLSYTCKTAVKAVIYLASKYETSERSGIKEISEYIDASEHTVGKILQTLVKQEVINSAKGPSGGFYISKEQRKQTIMNIVMAIDGKQVFKECGLALNKCSDTHPCPIHNEYKKAKDVIEKLFNTKKIVDLCGSVNNGLSHLIG